MRMGHALQFVRYCSAYVNGIMVLPSADADEPLKTRGLSGLIRIRSARSPKVLEEGRAQFTCSIYRNLKVEYGV